MLTSAILSLFVGSAPPPPDPRFDLILKSVTVENPVDGLIKGDQPVGVVVVVSIDPTNPRILGSFKYAARAGMKRNDVHFFPANTVVARNLEFPKISSQAFVHVAALEQDETQAVNGADKAFLQVHRQNLATYAQKPLANIASVVARLRIDFRNLYRSDRKLFVNDDDIVQLREIVYSDREKSLALASGFEHDLQCIQLGFPTKNGRHRLKFRLQKSAG